MPFSDWQAPSGAAAPPVREVAADTRCRLRHAR